MITNQRDYFNSGQTKDIDFRKEQLKKLKEVLKCHETDLYKAIHDDFKKSEIDTYITELSFIYLEIESSIKKTGWMGKEKEG